MARANRDVIDELLYEKMPLVDDAMIRALEDEVEKAEASGEAHGFSASFERKMDSLRNGKKAEPKHRRRIPYIGYALAAAAVLLVALCGGLVARMARPAGESVHVAETDDISEQAMSGSEATVTEIAEDSSDALSSKNDGPDPALTLDEALHEEDKDTEDTDDADSAKDASVTKPASPAVTTKPEPSVQARAETPDQTAAEAVTAQPAPQQTAPAATPAPQQTPAPAPEPAPAPAPQVNPEQTPQPSPEPAQPVTPEAAPAPEQAPAPAAPAAPPEIREEGQTKVDPNVIDESAPAPEAPEASDPAAAVTGQSTDVPSAGAGTANSGDALYNIDASAAGELTITNHTNGRTETISPEDREYGLIISALNDFRVSEAAESGSGGGYAVNIGGNNIEFDNSGVYSDGMHYSGEGLDGVCDIINQICN